MPSNQAPAFRVKFTDPHGTWWTMALANWVDVSRTVATLRGMGNGADVFINHGDLDREVQGYLNNANAEQERTQQPQLGEVHIGCTCGKCFSMAIAIFRVPEPRPDSQAMDEACCGAGEPIDFKAAADEQPRELRGPTQEEVAQHTPPSVLTFDPAGGRRKPTPASAAVPGKKDSWIDWLMEWALGTPKGSEVEK